MSQVLFPSPAHPNSDERLAYLGREQAAVRQLNMLDGRSLKHAAHLVFTRLALAPRLSSAEKQAQVLKWAVRDNAAALIANEVGDINADIHVTSEHCISLRQRMAQLSALDSRETPVDDRQYENLYRGYNRICRAAAEMDGDQPAKLCPGTYQLELEARLARRLRPTPVMG